MIVMEFRFEEKSFKFFSSTSSRIFFKVFGSSIISHSYTCYFLAATQQPLTLVVLGIFYLCMNLAPYINVLTQARILASARIRATANSI